MKSDNINEIMYYKDKENDVWCYRDNYTELKILEHGNDYREWGLTNESEFDDASGAWNFVQISEAEAFLEMV